MQSARLVRHSETERWSQQICRTGNDGRRPEREERQVGHESRERQAAEHPVETELLIGATGEARQALREDIESLSVVHDPERPANTRRIILSKRVSVTSRTA